MHNKEHITTLMTQERSELRNELIIMERSLHRVLFTFITISASVMALIINNEIFNDIKLRDTIIFIVSQIEFFLAVCAIFLVNNIFLHSAYIRALEDKLNHLLNAKVAIWESEIAENFISNTKGLTFWLTVFVFIISFGLYIYLIFFIIKQLNIWLIISIIIIEIIIPTLFLILCLWEIKRVYKHAKHVFFETK